MMGSSRASIRQSRAGHVLAAFCLVFSGCSAPATKPTTDPNEIVEAALQVVSADHIFGGPVCFDPLLRGAGLEKFGDTLRLAREEPSLRPIVDRIYAGQAIDWVAPVSDGKFFTPLDEALKRRLAGPFAAVLARQHSNMPPVQRVRSDFIPDSLLYQLGATLADPNCAAVVTISAPSIEGDFAFLEVEQRCGPTCGVGSILAFQHNASGWVVVGWAETWVS